MNTIFKFFIKNNLFAQLLTFLVLGIGFYQFMTISRSELPNIDIGYMMINTIYPGAAAEDVEQNVTNLLEDQLKGVTGIKKMTSLSMENSSSITIELDMDVQDVEKVKNNIRNAVSLVTNLPSEVKEKPYIIEFQTSQFPIIEVGIIGDIDYKELKDYSSKFEKLLRDIPEISSIDKYGWRAREIEIEVLPDKIKEYQVNIQDIIRMIQARNIHSTGGNIESYTSEKNIVTLAQFKDPMEVNDVIVRTSFDGPLVRVKDLAVVKDGFAGQRIMNRMNGKTAVSFQIIKKENADTIRTIDKIKKLIKNEEKNLPQGLSIGYSGDSSKYINNSIMITISNGIMGLILVFFALLIFFNIKVSFWVSLGIPFSIFGTVIVYKLLNLDLDTLTLCSIVILLGIIVDNSTVISDNIYSHIEKGEATLQATISGIREVISPIIASVLTTIIAFIPMFFMKGMIGKFIFVIPLTITIGIVLSLTEAVICLPAHLYHDLEKRKKIKPARLWFNHVRIFFEEMMKKVLKFRYIVILSIIAGFGFTAFVFIGNMNFVLFPTSGADVFIIRLEMPIGSSLLATSDKAKEIEAIIQKLTKNDLESFTTRIGRYEVSGITIEAENFAYLTVHLTPYGTRKKTAYEIVNELNKSVKKIKDIKNLVFEVVDGGPPSGKPVEVHVLGHDEKVRMRLVNDIMVFLGKQEGVIDVDNDNKPGKEQLNIKIKEKDLARLGLTVADIAGHIRIAYDGHVATRIRYGEEDVDFRVIIAEKYRKKVSYLEELLIPNNQGRMIPLKEVAYLESGPGILSFNHYLGERSTTITAGMIQKDNTPLNVMKIVRDEFYPKLKNYPGMHLKIGGLAQESNDALIKLLVTFIIALTAIYFIVVILFNSFTQPFLILTSIPFGVCGMIIFIAIQGEALSFMALIGGIGMCGIIVNNAIILVDHLNHVLKSGSGSSIIEVVAGGTADRLRSVLNTSLSTIVGLIPLSFGFGGHSVYMEPLSMAMTAGLIFSTPLTLIIVPSLYAIGNDINNLMIRIKALFLKKKV